MVAYKSDTVSLFGAFLLVGLMAIIPLISIFPANVHGVLSLLAGFSPAPGFGIVLGAGILAAALFWVVKSLLNGNTLGLIAGAALFGFEIILLGRYDVGLESLDLGTLDFVVLFGASLIAALAVGGLVTGRLDRAEASAR